MYTNQAPLVRTHVDLWAVKCKQTHLSTIQLQSECRYTPVCKYIYLKQGSHCSFCAVYMLLSLAAEPTLCGLNVVLHLLSAFCNMLVSGPVSRSAWYHYVIVWSMHPVNLICRHLCALLWCCRLIWLPRRMYSKYVILVLKRILGCLFCQYRQDSSNAVNPPLRQFVQCHQM
jgi:hypothetical protein